jgi:NAD(P)-dependent dehydrogenase (short-subunit alcohol dehydrogenase family)
MAKGKRILVTGSTRGIGRAAAECLIEAGAEVIVHGRRADDVGRVVGETGAHAGIAGDLASRGDVARIAAEAGEVDILVNSAGLFHEVALADLDARRWAETMEVNLTAPYLLARALLTGLRRRKGLIVNVASDAGVLGFAGGTVYCASKGALIGLTKALAVELAPDVRAIAISPGPVATDMMMANVAKAPDRQAELDRWAAYTHLNRVAAPREIGAVIAFACSDAAAFATGAVWSVDGGVTAGKRV